MTAHPDTEDELAQRIRRTLDAVAATVQHDPEHHGALRAGSGGRHRRTLLVGAAVTVAAIPLAAAAVLRTGPEFVDRIPPEDPILSGSLDGERYWVVDGRVAEVCQGSPSGIELIREGINTVGQEWDTVGAFFGEPDTDGCPPDQPREPASFTHYADGGVKVAGGGMIWLGALHPEVDQVLVTLGDAEPVDAEIFQHEGGSYYVLEVPGEVSTFTVDYLIDGAVVAPPAGERTEHVVPID